MVLWKAADRDARRVSSRWVLVSTLNIQRGIPELDNYRWTLVGVPLAQWNLYPSDSSMHAAVASTVHVPATHTVAARRAT